MIIDNSTQLNDETKSPNLLVIGALIYVFVMAVQGVIWTMRDPIAVTFGIDYSVAFWVTNMIELVVALLQTYLLRTSIWKKINSDQFDSKQQILKLVILSILTLVCSLALSYLSEWYIDKVNKGQPFLYPKEFYDDVRIYGSIFSYFKIGLIIWMLSIKK